MCSQTSQQRIHEGHRFSIAALSVLGFLVDGFQLTDPLFVLALVLWLWQPELERWEARVWDYLAANNPIKLSAVMLKAKPVLVACKATYTRQDQCRYRSSPRHLSS